MTRSFLFSKNAPVITRELRTNIRALKAPVARHITNRQGRATGVIAARVGNTIFVRHDRGEARPKFAAYHVNELWLRSPADRAAVVQPARDRRARRQSAQLA